MISSHSKRSAISANLRLSANSGNRGEEREIPTSIFFSSIVRSRGDGCSPRVIVLHRNGRPDAMLVGLKDRRKIPIRICSVTLFQKEVDVLEFVRGGLLGNASAENCNALVRAVMKSLSAGDADLALWEHLDVQSALHVSAIHLPNTILRDHCREVRNRWFLDHPRGLEALFRSLGQSQRSKLRRKYKRFLTTFAGKIQVRCFRTTAEMGEAVRDMEEIARNSVKRHLGFGFFNTPSSREQLLVEAAQGWLLVYILYVAGRPVSFWKGTLYGRCLQADHVGFNSAWSDFSPGIFLFLKIIEDLANLDVETVDFGTGDGQFYDSFAKTRYPEARVHIFAPRLGGLELSLMQTMARYVTLLIQGTSCLVWARKAIWKARKSALESISQNPSCTECVKPHGHVLYSERQ